MFESNEWYKRIAERLNFLANYRGITMEELAGRMEMPLDVLSGWLSGKLRRCDLKSIEKLAKELKVRPDYIIMEVRSGFENEV